jgi:hypothetical protein
MSWIWWILWIAVSVFLFGVFAWTTKALFEQKKVWKAFADKYKLAYRPNRVLDSATVSGKLDGNEFFLASEERLSADMRGRRFMTMMQFKLPCRMPVPAAVASGYYMDYLRTLAARDVLELQYPGWDGNTVLAVSDDRTKIEPYFTPERLKILDTLIKQKTVSVLFLFDDRDTYLRLETVDPLLKPGQLEKLVEKILPMLKVLYP